MVANAAGTFEEDFATAAYLDNTSAGFLLAPTEEILLNVTGSGNGTGGVAPRDPSPALLKTALMFFTGVLSNVIALVVLCLSRRERRRSVFYTLVSGLAWTDLIGTLVVSPFALIVYANNFKWVGGEPLCKFHAFNMVAFGLCTNLIVAVMAVERYIALSHPYFYNIHIDRKKARIAIACVWVYTILFSLLPFVGVGRYEIQYPGTWCFFSTAGNLTLTEAVYPYAFAATGILIILGTTVLNVSLIFTMFKMRRRSLEMQTCREMRRLRKEKEIEIQMVVLLVGVTVVFTICWGPIMVRIIHNTSGGAVNHAADLLAINMASINQILDPWVYILFRKELLILFFRFLRVILCGKARMSIEPSIGSGGIGSGGRTEGHVTRPARYQEDFSVIVNGSAQNNQIEMTELV
ncbi:prostaglandin E2 receptor EP4 subtype-like [Branchiostoma floridae x Branchiostoma belcheri]